jgi:hypothetical protein
MKKTTDIMRLETKIKKLKNSIRLLHKKEVHPQASFKYLETSIELMKLETRIAIVRLQ